MDYHFNNVSVDRGAAAIFGEGGTITMGPGVSAAEQHTVAELLNQIQALPPGPATPPNVRQAAASTQAEVQKPRSQWNAENLKNWLEVLNKAVVAGSGIAGAAAGVLRLLGI